jgi:hypothetical protein
LRAGRLVADSATESFRISPADEIFAPSIPSEATGSSR